MGRPPRIDRSSVLTAGLAIADERGLDALTLQAVADRLGVTPMALYRHVPGKAALLDGMVELLLTNASLPPAELPWHERLERLATGVRATARRHPEVFSLLLQRPATTTEARRLPDQVLAALVAAGGPPARASRWERLLSTAVLGFAVSEVAGRFAGHTSAELDGDFEALLGMLRTAIEAEGASG